jgi:hypothetical protein
MPNPQERVLWELASLQHGILTTAEIVGLVGDAAFRRLVKGGFLERLWYGVYRVRGAPVTERQALVGVVKASGGYASHKTRGALEGLDYCTFGKLHVVRSVAGSPNRNFGEVRVVRHRTNFLPAHHLEVVDGIPSTTLVRALCDMSAVMSLDRLEKLVDGCKRKHLLEYDELAVCREEMRAQGRRRTTVLDEILAERVAGYLLGESPPEDMVIRWVAEAGFEPKPQHWAVANGKRRRIDVAVVDDKVAIEYQGLDEHANGSAVIRDSEKITDLQLAGWFVVLVTKKTTKAKFMRDLARAVEIQRQARRDF